MRPSPVVAVDYTVNLPSGGKLHLQTPDEADLWNKALDKYRDDYHFQKHNDLINLGALLQQQVVLYRCQVAINGMEPELDPATGVPTGSYRRVDLDGNDLAGYQKTLTASAVELARLEKALGIDKVTRESGGAHTIDSYLKTLKRAAHERGIHITEMVTEYQNVFKELSWRLRLLYRGDPQDRAYHDITPKTTLDWLWDEIHRLEAKDKEWARTVGKLYTGSL
jgi:hypothetical protein